MTQPESQSVCIAGGTGFLGKYVVEKLLSTTEYSLRLLSRNPIEGLFGNNPRISFFRGELLNVESLKAFLQSNSPVINLAYLDNTNCEENLQAVRNLVSAANAKTCPRFLHCSTAVVVGRTSEDTVDETTPCHPVTEYERTKYELEQLVWEENSSTMETVSIRPTAVFGPGGKYLVKLADDLTSGTEFVRFLKNSLYGKRKLNAVCVENVAAAISFLATTEKFVGGETYIVSDDDAAENNYRDVARYLGRTLKLHGRHSLRVPIPEFLLRSTLTLSGRSNTNPRRSYSSQKIEDLGFRKQVKFYEGLESFCEWYRNRRHL